MYQRILFSYDGSEAGQRMLLDCQELAQWSHAHLWLVAVQPPQAAQAQGYSDAYAHEMDRQRARTMERVLQEGVCRLSARGYQAHSALLQGDSVQVLSEFAHTVQADLIVVGHRHLARWAARWWAGALSAALIEQAPCSVLFSITPTQAHQIGQSVDL